MQRILATRGKENLKFVREQQEVTLTNLSVQNFIHLKLVKHLMNYPYFLYQF